MILTMMVVVMLTMMILALMLMLMMMMVVVMAAANPGHVPTRQSNERSVSSTTNHHGQVNIIIIIISLHFSSIMHFCFDNWVEFEAANAEKPHIGPSMNCFPGALNPRCHHHEACRCQKPALKPTAE